MAIAVTIESQLEARGVEARMTAGGEEALCKVVTLTIHGRRTTSELAPWVTLLDLLRDRLDLTGTKKGCDHGQCGACTVLINGRRINSCLTLAVMHNGAEIVTVEGLGGPDAALHPLQQAFIDHDAFQCGYCTPGQLCSAAGLLREHRPVNASEIRERMSGNLCRCGAYPQIVAAVAEVVAASAGNAAPACGTRAP
jgi:xanthine dehydrogenase YagT iron-sulfur-binding subunit